MAYVYGHRFACRHTAAVRIAYRYAACSGGHGYVITGSHVFAYGDFARTGRYAYAAIGCGNLLAYVNIPLVRLHGHIFVNGYILSERNITLSLRFCIQRSLGLHIIGHQQVAILRNQGCIIPGFYYTVVADTVVINDDVLAGCAFRIILTGSLQGNIPILGRSLAVNDDLSFHGFQIYIILCRYGRRIGFVAANMDIAVYRLNAHICAL